MRQNWHLRSASVSTPSLLDMAVSSQMHLLSGPKEGQLLPHARVKMQLQLRDTGQFISYVESQRVKLSRSLAPRIHQLIPQRSMSGGLIPNIPCVLAQLWTLCKGACFLISKIQTKLSLF